MDIEEQYDKIYRYCYFKIFNKQLAQDITQETFLRFYKQELHLNNGKHLAYLYTIARNLCIDEFRKKTVDSSLEDFEEEVIYDPCEEWIDNLTLRSIIGKLPHTNWGVMQVFQKISFFLFIWFWSFKCLLNTSF